MEKYRGRFDDGWDAVRDRWFARQVEMGIVPAHTRLAPRNPGVEAWTDLPEVQRQLAARLQEAFAAFLDHTDAQIGRLVDGLRRLGRLDNTILMVLADNGASQEGGPYGVMHEMKFFNGILETPEQAVARIDDIGGPNSHTNYPWGWAQAGNTPFRWYKQNTHEGGVHVPLVVHWPSGIAEDQRGSLRDQFVHVSDIAPTLYDLAGVEAPAVFHGVEQIPVSGRSFSEIIDDASAPAANTLQYFENGGSRALVAGEWKAVCRHVPGADFDTEAWELYDLSADPSECLDLAADQPERLERLKDLWWEEAERHGVLPLDDRTFELFGARFRDRSPHPADRRYVYRPPMSPIPAQAAAQIGGRNFDLTALLERDASDDGVLFATGTANAGISVFVLNGHLHVDYNAFFDHTIAVSTIPVPTGSSTVSVAFRRGEGSTGRIDLRVDDHEAGSVEIPFIMRVISSVGASVGRDAGSAVSTLYSGPFAFSGVINELEIRLLSRRDAETADAEARAEMGRQ
jgi:arylsulfatase